MRYNFRINDSLICELASKRVGDDQKSRMSIISDNCIHMARLASYVSSYINGVAKIHTDILKNDVLRDWANIYPERFQNKTNGITQRRWLGLCNPELTGLISDKIGDGFLLDLDRLEELRSFADDDALWRFHEIKQIKKQQLSRIISDREGVNLSPMFIFDTQVKRMHEYKRQLMNAFSIMWIYFSLKEGKLPDFTPTAFIFGAKAAPGYFRAKGIIKYINEIARLINGSPDMQDRLRVVFVQNYNVSYAEHIIPAADISEQISPAGTEASGTGNMKFMLNGTVTLGTYDGANIEIIDAAGAENNYIFGAAVEELRALGDNYNPKSIYDSNAEIRRVLDTLVDGTFSDNGSGMFKELFDAILYGASWHKPDHYHILLDLPSYIQAKLRANRDYKDTAAFARKCFLNTAAAGRFSSDRTVKEYAMDIWHVEKPIHTA